MPGYYLRLNKDGAIENSTCMNNTASEHYMMDRLIVDDLKHWAVNYKVNSFHNFLKSMITSSSVLHFQKMTSDSFIFFSFLEKQCEKSLVDFEKKSRNVTAELSPVTKLL